MPFYIFLLRLIFLEIIFLETEEIGFVRSVSGYSESKGSYYFYLQECEI